MMSGRMEWREGVSEGKGREGRREENKRRVTSKRREGKKISRKGEVKGRVDREERREV